MEFCIKSVKEPAVTVSRRVLPLVLAICGLLISDFSLVQPAVAQTKPAAQGTKDSKDSQTQDEDWNVIYMGTTRIGYSRSSTRTIKRDGRELIRSESESTMLIKRFGQELKMKLTIATEETREGELLAVEFINDNPPASHTKTTGKVVGDKLELLTENAGKTSKKSLAWDKENKSPAYQDRMLQEQPLKPSEKRQFKVFMPEMNQIATVTITAKDVEEVTLLGGKKDQLKRVDITQSILPGFVTKTWIDDEGHTVKSSTGGFFGTDMSTYRVDRDEALKEIAGAELDIAMDTLIKIKPPIERAHESQQIVYTVTIKGHDPAQELPSGDTQQIKATGPETAELTVTAVTPPAAAEGPVKAAEAGFLGTNRYLQSDDERVIEHAIAATGETTAPWDAAVKMEQYVHEKLTKKNFSTALATAAEVAASLEGDCTEHACLLAAMCRVKKIPSRVVVGFVYAERLEAFGGHMWTEVFLNGKWIPLDATLGRGGIGAAHIKLADTGFQEDGPSPTASFLPILRVIGNMTLQVKSVTYRK